MNRINKKVIGTLCILLLLPDAAHAALSIDGHASNVGGGSSMTLTLTTTQANDIVVLHEFNESGTASVLRTVSSVTDVAGLMWHLRSATTSPDMAEASSPDGVDNEIWWALAPAALSGDTVTINLSGSTDCSAGVIFGVNGANTSSPWDINGSLPAIAIQPGTGATTPAVSGISTTNSSTMILGFMGTGAYGSNDAGSPSTSGSGYTLIDQAAQPSCGLAATTVDEYQIVSSAQSGITAALGNPLSGGTEGWFMVGDAIQASASAPAGRIIRLIGNVRLIGGVRLGGTSPIPSSVCSQYTSFIGRVSVDSAHQTDYQNLICGLVTDGVWSKLDLLYVFATQNSSAALDNLISSSFTATASNAPTFAADTGYAGNGSSAYIDSNYNVSTQATNFTQNSSSLFAWSTEAGADNGTAVGNAATCNYGLNITPYSYSATAALTLDSNLGISWSNPGPYGSSGAGFYTGSRTSSTQVDLYQNSTDVAASSSNASIAPPSADITFLTTGGSCGSYFSGNLGAAGVGGGLTSTDVSNLYARLHTFLHAVNATLYP